MKIALYFHVLPLFYHILHFFNQQVPYRDESYRFQWLYWENMRILKDERVFGTSALTYICVAWHGIRKAQKGKTNYYQVKKQVNNFLYIKYVIFNMTNSKSNEKEDLKITEFGNTNEFVFHNCCE